MTSGPIRSWHEGGGGRGGTTPSRRLDAPAVVVHRAAHLPVRALALVRGYGVGGGPVVGRGQSSAGETSTEVHRRSGVRLEDQALDRALPLLRHRGRCERGLGLGAAAALLLVRGLGRHGG